MPLPAAIGFLTAAIGAALTVANLFDPLKRELLYRANTIMPNTAPSPEDAVNFYRRGIITKPMLEDILRKWGYDIKVAGWYAIAALNRLPISAAVDLYFRGKISEEKLAEVARANGLNLEDLKYVIEASRPMPSPSDIVRFAIREVFNPAVIAKYGYLEDLPSEFVEELKKTGMEEKYAKMYWAAHWELPSLTMGIELFRRKVISEDELKLLMKLHDLAPGWRDKLLELAYEIPTRVDLRRMYEMGVITEQQLQDYYEKLGYKPEDAKLLVEWTKLEYNAEVRNLTVSKVLDYFAKGYIDRNKAKHYLLGLGVPEDIAEIMLTDKEREAAEKELEERIRHLRTLRSLGVITQEEFKNELAKLGLPSKAVEVQVKSVERERAARAKLPSLGDLKRWLKLSIISEEEFAAYLRELGYREKDIEKYIAEVKLSTIPVGE
ncbi:MAG: hypothetical protein QW230_00825 [Thermofilum sp.]